MDDIERLAIAIFRADETYEGGEWDDLREDVKDEWRQQAERTQAQLQILTPSTVREESYPGEFDDHELADFRRAGERRQVGLKPLGLLPPDFLGFLVGRFMKAQIGLEPIKAQGLARDIIDSWNNHQRPRDLGQALHPDGYPVDEMGG